MTEPYASSATPASEFTRLEDAPRVHNDSLPRPMPRLGRGVHWGDIVAEIERDHLARLRHER